MTFLYEVIGGCRKALGPDLLLGVRLYDDMVDYSIGMNEFRPSLPSSNAPAPSTISMSGRARSRPQVLRRPLANYYREPGQFVYKANEIKQLVQPPRPGRR